MQSPVWQLLRESQLVPNPQIDQLLAEFYSTQQPNANSAQVIQWLVQKKQITAYQGKVFEAGRSGPFLYNDYVVYDRANVDPIGSYFRATHQPTGHSVLLKFLSGDAVTDPGYWNELVSETRLQSLVIQADLMRLYAIEDLGSFRFLVFEDSDCESIVGNDQRISTESAVEATYNVCQALEAIHKQGQVHGHLSPDHFLLTKDKNFILYRDPIAAPFSRSETPENVSKADFAAPELAIPGAKPTAASDLYAVGAVLYQLLAGLPPFANATTLKSKISHHATKPIPNIKKKGLPPQLKQIICTLMAKDANARPKSASAVANMLRPFASHFVSRAASPTSVAFETHLNPNGNVQVPISTSPAQPVSQPITASPIATSPIVTSPSPVVAPATSGSVSTPSGLVRRSGWTPVKIGVLVGSLIMLLAIVGVLYSVLTSGNDAVAETENGEVTNVETNGTESGSKKSSTNKSPDTKPNNPDAFQNVVTDDGRMLWETPTEGEPISFAYVPSSVKGVISLRPSELLNKSEGELAFQALGQDFTTVREQIKSLTTFDLTQIEHLLLTIHFSGAEFIPAFSVTLNESRPLEQLMLRWDNPKVKSVPEENADYYPAKNGFAYYVPPVAQNSDGIRRFIMGSEEQIREIIENDGAPPALNLSVRQLLGNTDANRHCTVLFVPASIFSEKGRNAMTPSAAKFIDSLQWLFGDGVQAALISAHLDGDWYLETMMKTSVSPDAYQQIGDFESRLKESRRWIGDFVIDIPKHEHWQRVQFEFKGWYESMVKGTRYGVEDKLAIANSWIPAPAGHNLLAGSELMLAATTEPASVAASSGSSSSSNENKSPKTIEDLLAVNWEVDIPQQDLVFAVEEIQEGIKSDYNALPFPFEIKLLGGDLQLDGITQNQRVVDFKMKGTFAEILTGLVVKANPDPESTGASDARNKLIWVVGPKPGDDSLNIVLITTRAAAEKKGYTLPKAFELKE